MVIHSLWVSSYEFTYESRFKISVSNKLKPRIKIKKLMLLYFYTLYMCMPIKIKKYFQTNGSLLNLFYDFLFI